MRERRDSQLLSADELRRQFGTEQNEMKN